MYLYSGWGLYNVLIQWVELVQCTYTVGGACTVCLCSGVGLVQSTYTVGGACIVYLYSGWGLYMMLVQDSMYCSYSCFVGLMFYIVSVFHKIIWWFNMHFTKKLSLMIYQVFQTCSYCTNNLPTILVASRRQLLVLRLDVCFCCTFSFSIPLSLLA